MLSFFNEARALPIRTDNCLVIFYLDGPAYDAFELQVNKMRPQLDKLKINLIDLRHWQSTEPYKDLSGYDRRQIRKHFDMQHDVSQAVLLRPKHPAQHFKGTVDLIDFLLACQ